MEEIEILKRCAPRNVVFIGKPGLNKLELAKEMAASWLGTQVEALDLHPDYLYIEPSDGLIRSEQTELIRRKAQICPHGAKAVCLVNGAESMSADLQNKLLKVLEDSDKELAAVFLTTCELLETVMSRCMAVHFWPMGLEEMYAHYQKPNIAALIASDGCPGIYDAILSDDGFLIYLEGFYQAMCGFRAREQVKNLLRLTHALKEKDREYLGACLEAGRYADAIQRRDWALLALPQRGGGFGCIVAHFGLPGEKKGGFLSSVPVLSGPAGGRQP